MGRIILPYPHDEFSVYSLSLSLSYPQQDACLTRTIPQNSVLTQKTHIKGTTTNNELTKAESPVVRQLTDRQLTESQLADKN